MNRIAAVKACLTSKGLAVHGGATVGKLGPNSPDGELITTGAFIAFYTDASNARRLEPALKQNAMHIGGQVERHGAVTVLWIRPPATRLRNDVSACVLG